jgi:hypothetical protein
MQRSDLSDSHIEKLLVKDQAKILQFGKSDSLARQGGLAGWLAGTGLMLSRNPAMDRLIGTPDWSSSRGCTSR